MKSIRDYLHISYGILTAGLVSFSLPGAIIVVSHDVNQEYRVLTTLSVDILDSLLNLWFLDTGHQDTISLLWLQNSVYQSSFLSGKKISISTRIHHCSLYFSLCFDMILWFTKLSCDTTRWQERIKLKNWACLTWQNWQDFHWGGKALAMNIIVIYF